MTEKRFTIIQDGDYFTVIDNLKNRSMGMFEFKEDEFPVYFCFHKIIDLLNELEEEKQKLNEKLTRYIIDYNGLGCEYEWLEEKNNRQAKQLELYKELYPSGEWITELTTEELEKDFKGELSL